MSTNTSTSQPDSQATDQADGEQTTKTRTVQETTTSEKQPEHIVDGFDSLPKWAQDELRSTRAEAAKYRTAAKDATSTAEQNAAELAQFRALADASKSETDRLNDRIAALEKQTRDAETARSRAVIQNRYGLDDEEAADLLDGNDIERMERRAARYKANRDAQAEAARKAAQDAETAAETAARKAALVVPAEGTNPAPVTDERRQFARNLFGA